MSVIRTPPAEDHQALSGARVACRRATAMPRYQVTAEGQEDVWVTCPGCSGDALALALKDRDMQSFKVHRRSGDGRQWWFDVTFGPGRPGASGEDSGTRVVSVSRIDD